MPEIPLMLGSLGMNNKVDPTDLQFDPQTGLVELAYAVNVDIERPFRVVSRRGYTKRISLASGAHSFFYAGGQFGVFASGSSLYVVTSDYSYTAVATVTSGLKIRYCKAGDDIFYTNGKENGVIKGSTRTRVDWKRETGYDSPPDYPTSNRSFSDFPVGTLLASVGSRIFCAVGDTVFYSEPWWYGYCDEEANRFSLNGGITLLESVADGLYVADSETTYWVKDAGDGRFDATALPPGFGPAIPGTAVRCDGKLVNDNYYGNGVIWVSNEQICWGGPGGFYMDLSSDRIRLPDAASGAALMYDKKYIASLDGVSYAICMNLGSAAKPVTFYSNYLFDSLGVMNDSMIGTGSAGLYSLADSDTDDGTDITASLEIYTDLNKLGITKLRSVTFHGAASGNVVVSVSTDDVASSDSWQIVTNVTCKRRRMQAIVSKNLRGNYWRIGISSLDGSRFTIDKIIAAFVTDQA